MDYKELFHVHTYRCGHAGTEKDIDYINKAIDLRAKSIYFTDHAPFPGDIFGNRMKIEELNEYVETLVSLKREFESIIEINIGLEIEYIPKFISYYKWLIDKYNLSLFLGQHICFYNGQYSFEYKNKKNEYRWMANSIMEALDTKLFESLLHPERIYKNSEEWGKEQEKSAKEILEIAKKNNIPVEYNYSSKNANNIKFWHNKFWNIENQNQIIYGLDAHNTQELNNGTLYFRNYK